MKKTFLMCLFGFISICFVSLAQESTSEELTISTYYPAPYGVYKELRNQRAAIGENYIDGSQYCWEGACTTQFDSDADLVVEGNVGIGTEDPKAKLDVDGGIKVGRANGCNPGGCSAATAGTIRYCSNILEYCDGSSNQWKNAFGTLECVHIVKEQDKAYGDSGSLIISYTSNFSGAATDVVEWAESATSIWPSNTFGSSDDWRVKGLRCKDGWLPTGCASYYFKIGGGEVDVAFHEGVCGEALYGTFGDQYKKHGFTISCCRMQ